MPVMNYTEIALAAAFAILALAACLLQPPGVREGVAAVPAMKPMYIVVVTGKRMTPEEKRQSHSPG